MEMARHITLTKYNGKVVELPAVVRRAMPAEHPAFVALQNAVVENMPDKSLYVASTPDELLHDVTQNPCVGVWVQQKAIAALEQSDTVVTGEVLVAYMTMRYDGESEHNYANYLDVPKAQLSLWANMDSVLVLPQYRGNQLQQRLFDIMVAWRAPHIIGVGCTVSPENQHSLANAKASGFEVYTRRMMYGHYDRYVLRKPLGPLPGKYRHFKGNKYRVLCVAKHSETCGEMVVYQALYGEGGTWVRPAEMWFDQIERDGYCGPRFVYIGE